MGFLSGLLGPPLLCAWAYCYVSMSLSPRKGQRELGWGVSGRPTPGFSESSCANRHGSRVVPFDLQETWM